MGISRAIWEMEKSILSENKFDYVGLKLCELGNQRMSSWSPSYGHVEYAVAKLLYSSLGVLHMSIDINGQDGSVNLDLTKEVPRIFSGFFDVITNHGTSEHVDDQDTCFKNIFSLCREGGLIINVVPLAGSWPGHCKHYYTPEIMAQICQSAGHEIIKNEIITEWGNELVFSVWKKAPSSAQLGLLQG
jgi:hypothetical protein